MRQIVYDIAMTLDGFICHLDGSIEGFEHEGGHLSEYFERLETYETVLMGRKTYEFGYQYGLKPGGRAYPKMDHYIFSRTLQCSTDHINIVDRNPIEQIRKIKNSEGGEIYLCGGGSFAGYLLDHQLIDRLVVKLNPIVFGEGIRVFGESTMQAFLSLIDQKAYGNGVTLLRYDVDYSK